MAEHVQPSDAEVPPISEQVHLPDPSYLPVVTAAGITIVLVGVLVSWIICGMGVLITLIAIVRWIRSAREEMAELPVEH